MLKDTKRMLPISTGRKPSTECFTPLPIAILLLSHFLRNQKFLIRSQHK